MPWYRKLAPMRLRGSQRASCACTKMKCGQVLIPVHLQADTHPNQRSITALVQLMPNEASAYWLAIKSVTGAQD